MKTRVLRLFALIAVLSVAAAAFGQGFYTESTTSGGAIGDRTMTSKSYYMPKMIKVVSDDEGTAMIFRIDRQKVYEVNPAEKTYSETSFADWETKLKAVNSRMDAQMAELQKQMAEMPEEQRKMVEQMMGGKTAGGASARIDVAKTGERKSVSGRRCVRYALTEDGKEVMSVWATRDIRGFDAMKRDYDEFSRRMMSVNVKGVKDLADAMKKIDGFPMEIDFGEGMKTVVSKVESMSIAPDEFEVPAGFTQVKSKLEEAEEQSNE